MKQIILILGIFITLAVSCVPPRRPPAPPHPPRPHASLILPSSHS
ncbi:hypothetical protein ACE38W_17350 [Chitinophaga sp. Hz27]